jgi:hypothetical protein
MSLRLVAAALLAAGLHGCVAYEYEHEFWLRVDGSGTVHVTGRPELWAAFKGVGNPRDPGATVSPEALRARFERSGLRVSQATLTHRGGRAYLFVSADFDDVNALSGTPAFPDLRLGLRTEGDTLILEGTWQRPKGLSGLRVGEPDGLMAVRFHLPSRVYSHKNAVNGVERGNIVGWQQPVGRALAGGILDFGAVMDRRSILGSTVALFAGSLALAISILAACLYAAFRRGRRERQTAGGGPSPPP